MGNYPHEPPRLTAPAFRPPRADSLARGTDGSKLYFHKDRGLTGSMIERCIAANFDVLALTVDTITGGNRARDLRTGFTSPPRLTLKMKLLGWDRTICGRLFAAQRI